MNRRQVLAAAAGALPVALAGCAHPTVVLEMDEVSDEEIAGRAAVSPRGENDSDIVRAATEDGVANATASNPPLDPDRPVEFRGAYYELSLSRAPAPGLLEFRVRVESGADVPDADAIAFEDLPPVDRDLLDRIVPPADGGEEAGAVYDDDERAASVLVPDLEYRAVDRGGERYRVDVVGRHAVERFEFRYEATRIADDPASFADWVRSEYRFELTGLSADEREIVEEAVEEGYFDGSPTDAFSSLARRFRSNRAVRPSDWGGEFLVLYRGTEYWADLQHPPSDASS